MEVSFLRRDDSFHIAPVVAAAAVVVVPADAETAEHVVFVDAVVDESVAAAGTDSW